MIRCGSYRDGRPGERSGAAPTEPAGMVAERLGCCKPGAWHRTAPGTRLHSVVERAVDLRDLLGLAGLVLTGRVRSPARRRSQTRASRSRWPSRRPGRSPRAPGAACPARRPRGRSARSGAISIFRYRFRPVAAGISLPMITFSFSPSRRSILPSIAASVSTFVVSWNEAAERNDSVASDAFVMPRMSGS